MKTYNAVACYSGGMAVTVQAENDLDAEDKVKKHIAELTNDEFLDQLEPQLVDIELEDLG